MTDEATEGPIGRADEAIVVERFLAGLDGGPRALVLTGSAGIGKTTLLDLALDRARAAGIRVLVTRAVEAEVQLAFGGLADLLGASADAVLARLPPAQRAALGIALQQLPVPDDPPPPLATSLAVHGALRQLSADRPLLVVIDDAPWLDADSSRVLAYAFRRVEGSRVGLLAAIRSDHPAVALPATVVAFGGPTERLHVAPLDLEATGRLLAGRLGGSVRRPTLAWIHDRARGNPFLIGEIAHALARAGGPSIDPGLLTAIVPDELVRHRLDALPTEARWPLAAMAAMGRPTLTVLTLAHPGAPGAIAVAAAAGVVQCDGDDLRFTHPLLASGAYAALDENERRELHGRLSVVMPDPEDRARHLALAADGPDAAIAAQLDAAAARAASRGASEVAAELRLLAVDRTPPGDDAALAARLVAAAEQVVTTGDAGRARSMLERHVDRLAPGPDRADVLRMLADTRSGDDWEARRRLLERALEEAGADPRRRGRIIETLAQTLGTLGETVDRRIALMRDAVALAEQQEDPETRVAAYLSCALAERDVGNPVRDDLLDRAVSLSSAVEHLRVLFWPAFARALLDATRDRHAEAHATMLALHAEAERRGDWDSQPLVALNIAGLEFVLGTWGGARRWAMEAEVGARQNGQPHGLAMALAVRSMIETALGTHDPGARWATEAIAAARSIGTRASEADGRAALGFHALAHGDMAVAARELALATDPWLAAGYRSAEHVGWLFDRCEALVGLGALQDARDITLRLAEVAAALGTRSAAAVADAARGMVAAAAGDEPAATDAFSRAFAATDGLPMPFLRARLGLAHGEALRRFRRRGAARETLVSARDEFARLGAQPWVRRAEAELARTGHRAPGAALTPTEAQVARLVAAGRSNREIGDALFMSPHTVEAHLTRIYRTQEVRGRADLARLVASGALDLGPEAEIEGSG